MLVQNANGSWGVVSYTAIQLAMTTKDRVHTRGRSLLQIRQRIGAQGVIINGKPKMSNRYISRFRPAVIFVGKHYRQRIDQLSI